MSDTKPVVIRFADGTEYGVASIEVAERVYPTAEVVRYQDGQPVPPAEVDLEAMSRDELNAYATEQGVENAEKFPNKPALIEAITAAGEAGAV